MPTFCETQRSLLEVVCGVGFGQGLGVFMSMLCKVVVQTPWGGYSS